jgi:hypothetical protein
MKKTLLLFITLLAITVTKAQTFTVDNIDYEVILVEEVATTNVQVNGSTLAAVTIPATVSNGGVDYNVTLIKAGAWRDINTTTITSIVVMGDTEIGLQAFQGCTNLVSADLKNVTSRIGNSAFLNCSTLETVNLSSLAAPIGNNGFKNCTALTSINAGNVTEIGTQAFTGCALLTSIDLPSATLVGNLAFFNCTGLTQVTIPVIEKINTGAFNNTGLTSITFPASLTTLIELNYNMFKNCKDLKTITVLNETPLALTYNAAIAGESLFKNAETELSVTNLIVPAGAGAAYFAADVWKDLSITEAAPLGLNSLKELSFSAYPNPTTDYLNFSSKEVFSVDIYNILGAKVSSQKVVTNVNMTQLNKGIYFIKAKNIEGLEFKTIKVIKQ